MTVFQYSLDVFHTVKWDWWFYVIFSFNLVFLQDPTWLFVIQGHCNLDLERVVTQCHLRIWRLHLHFDRQFFDAHSFRNWIWNQASMKLAMCVKSWKKSFTFLCFSLMNLISLCWVTLMVQLLRAISGATSQHFLGSLQFIKMLFNYLIK